MFSLESFHLAGNPLQRGYGLRAAIALTLPVSAEPPIRVKASAAAFTPFREQAEQQFRSSPAGSRLLAKRNPG